MIELPNVNATRTAFKLASRFKGETGNVMLAPDHKMFATDGFAMIVSNNAHDADLTEPMFVSSPVGLSFTKSALGYKLNVEEGTLVEERPRSEISGNVEIKRGLRFPDVYSRIPSHLTRMAGETPDFDSIKAGRIASDYGLDVGRWVKGAWDDVVWLYGTEETDMIMLARLRSPIEQS